MLKQSIFYVYVYLDPRKPGNFNYGKFHFDFEPFYVGKGKEKRYIGHLEEAKGIRQNHKLNLIRKILQSGISEKEMSKKYILKVQENMTEFCAFGLELYLIKLIGRCDFESGPLVNKTRGGEGVAEWICTDSYRKNMSIAINLMYQEMDNKTKKIKYGQPGESNPMYGKSAVKEKIWIHKNQKEIYIKKEDLKTYINMGYEKGRSLYKCKYCEENHTKGNLERHHNYNCPNKNFMVILV